MKKERIFWGVFFIIGAILLIVSGLGYLPDLNVFKMILTIPLVIIMAKSVMYLSFEGILLPLAFIAIIYGQELGITAITPFPVLIAAVFASIGLSMIFGNRRKYFKKNYKNHDYKFETIDIEDEGHVRVETSFGNSTKYINSDKFEQAEISCNFGGMKVYFDKAVMKNGRAILKLEASFSGVALFIPREWTVVDDVNIAFASFDEKNKNYGTEENILTIVGDINFSGVDVFYI